MSPYPPTAKPAGPAVEPTAPLTTRLPEALTAFGYRNFRLFWVGGLISASGRFFQVVAIPAIIWSLTRSPFWVGLAGFAQMVPMALVAPFSGALADRHPRRKVLMVTQASQALVAVVFAAIWWGGIRSPSAYIAVSALAGLFGGLNLPAWQAFVSELVPRGVMLNAITLNSVQFNSARMIGPVLAGVTVARAGAGTAFAINAVSYLAVIVALFMIDTPDVVKTSAERFRPARDIFLTAGYICRRAGIATAVAVVCLLGFFGLSIQVLSVVLAEEVFDRGPSGYGLMLTMIGVGAVVSAPLVASLGGRVNRSSIQGVALIVYGCAILGIALAPSFLVALVALAVMGAAHLTSASVLNTTVQLQVDEDHRAKVLGMYLMMLLLANPLGQLVLGRMMESIGPRASFAVAGGVLACTAVVLAATGALNRLDDEPGTYEPQVLPEVHPTTPVPPRHLR